MKRLILAMALALSLGGCASFQTAWDTVTGARVSPNAVYLASNAYDSVEIVATTYLRTCHKSPGTFAACAKSIEIQVVDAVRAGRKARADVRNFMVAHPDALGVAGLYDALQQATSTLQSIINTYNLGKVAA